MKLIVNIGEQIGQGCHVHDAGSRIKVKKRSTYHDGGSETGCEEPEPWSVVE
jgi:hypothetical protein